MDWSTEEARRYLLDCLAARRRALSESIDRAINNGADLREIAEYQTILYQVNAGIGYLIDRLEISPIEANFMLQPTPDRIQTVGGMH